MIKEDITNKLRKSQFAAVYKVLFLLTLSFSFSVQLSFSQGACNDRAALVALYNATDGANWTVTWDLSAPITEWDGVFTNADTCVIRLELDGNGLNGTIPVEIDSFEFLEDLFLNGNNLSGPIPDLGNLRNLQRLNLSGNALTGRIPESIGDLGGLRTIDLSSNALTGRIPASLGNLANLESLNLSNNSLDGEIPESFGMLTSITNINLSINEIEGGLPETVRNLSNLQTLNLTSNRIDELPDDLNTYTNPSILVLLNNQLTFEDLLPDNILKESFFFVPQDSVGDYRPVFLNPGENYTINLGFDEAVEGNSYEWYKDGSFLAETGENKFPINDVQEIDEGLYTVIVRNPNVPSLTLFTRPFEIIVTDLSCRVDDSLALVSLYNSTDGANWVETWNLDTLMSTWYGVSTNAIGCVDGLELSSNNLVGTLPDELGSIVSLETLVLSVNSISDSIPTTLGDLVNLEVLFLDGNALSDTIPEELGQLFALDSMDLSNNLLEGNFPIEFGRLTNLSFLSLANNNLDGDLPEELGDMLGLVNLSLNDNGFSGTIPEEISELQNLLFFNVSDNQITGIPESISMMDRLEELRLSNNSLSGIVPVELTQMDSLKVLFVNGNRYNDLPDMSPLNGDNIIVRVDDNQLTFEDLVPENVTYLEGPNDRYAPQDSVGQGGTVSLNVGDNYRIELGIDSLVTTNLYRWFKDGAFIQETSINSLLLTNLQLEDAGEYNAEITNPNAPDLVLYSRPVIITINEEESISINGPDSVCVGSTATYSVEAGRNVLWDISPEDGEIVQVNPDNSIVVLWRRTGGVLLSVVDINTGTSAVKMVEVIPNLVAPEVSYEAIVRLGDPPTPLVAAGSMSGVIIRWYTDSLLTNQVHEGDVYIPTATLNTSILGTTTFYVTQELPSGCVSPPTPVIIEVVESLRPDLLVSLAQVIPGQVIVNGTVEITAEVINVNEEIAPESTLRVFFSTDDQIDGNDSEITSITISSLGLDEEDLQQFSLTIPADVEPGTYFLIFVADADGIIDEEDETNNTVAVLLTIIDPNVDLTIMNVITPNGDGLNEVLFIENIEFFPDGEITIINKWGFEVFKTTNYQNDWRAEDFSGRPLPPGNYICIVNFNESGRETIKEIVAVIRP